MPTPKPRLILALAGVMLAPVLSTPIAAQETPQPAGSAQSWSFNDDEVGKRPKGWTLVETSGAGTPARWAVVADQSSPDGPNAIAVQDNRNTSPTFNLLLKDDTSFKDVAISVRVRAKSGREEQGGGPVWRARDANNYYVARWNPLRNNFRVYAVKNGKRKMLAGVEAKVDPKGWHEIRVEMIGNRILASLDDRHFIETQDTTLIDAGKIGLWTEADATTVFDEVKVSEPDTSADNHQE